LITNEPVRSVEDAWRIVLAYTRLWLVEPGIHFRKEALGWTHSRFQSKEVGDRWSEPTVIVCRLLFLARLIMADAPLPWQKPQQRLTLQRVQQSLQPIFELIGSPALPPKRRGNAPGWP
jgi:hypothetical protein